MNSKEYQSKICNERFDCSEIADDLKKIAGEGYHIEVRNIDKFKDIKVQEGSKIEEYENHIIYTDGKYVYDPRLSLKPIPKGDWIQHIKNINKGNKIKIKEIKE